MQIFDSQKIKTIRIQRGTSQKALAEAVGVTYQTISRWESGKAQPTDEQIEAMAVALNAEISDFYHIDITGGKQIKGMESICEIYKIGRGPSSSHTMGPERACREFVEKNPKIDAMKVILYGSLAKTGKGHGTDYVLVKTASPIPCEVVFDFDTTDIPHPNTLDLYGYKDGEQVAHMRVMSVGGGSIAYDGAAKKEKKIVYPHHTFGEIAAYCKEKSLHLWQYALEFEGEGLWAYMEEVWEVMKQAVLRGIKDHGTLPGGLSVKKKARDLYSRQHIDESAQTREHRLVCAYAFAVGEQNASGEMIVTAPTCGAAGVLPAVLYYQQRKNKYSDRQMLQALMVAGVVVYVKQRGRADGKTATRHEEYTDVAEDEITIEKIVSYVRECGSLVTCVPRDEGGYSIIIRYGDEVYNIVWEDRLVQVVGRYWFGNEEEPSGAFIQAFMFASNIVMSNKHFVQTYIDKDVCVYMTSGYVRTMTDIREYIPVYLSIVKESIALHRHYTTEIMKDIEKMQSESRPMTTKDSRVN